MVRKVTLRRWDSGGLDGIVDERLLREDANLLPSMAREGSRSDSVERRLRNTGVGSVERPPEP